MRTGTDSHRASTSGMTWVTVTAGRPLMASDDANDGQALTGGDITKYRALVARLSIYVSRGRPELKFASM